MIKLSLKMLLAALIISGCSSAPKTSGEEPIESGAEKSDTKIGDNKMVEMKPADTKPEAPSAAPPEPKDPRYDALNSAVAANNEDKIRNISVELLQNNSKDVKAMNALAMYHFKKGNHEATQLLLNKILAINPKSSTAYNNLGMISLARGEKRDAIENFKKAIEFDSDNYAAGINLGSIYLKEKDYSKAVLALENAVSDRKADVNSMNNYAIALAATGKPQDAERIYQDILKDSPSNKNVMLNLAIVLIEKLNKPSDGLDLLNRLKFVGVDIESRQVIKDLENKAKAGLK
jgi:Flp pilus assembly protein TadD